MIIQLQHTITPAQQEALLGEITAIGYKANEVTTQAGKYLVLVGKKDVDIRRIGGLAGVKDIHVVSDSYQLVSRKWKVRPTVIDLGDGVTIGDGGLALMAGPCSIENEAQIKSVIDHLVGQGIRIMRGGVYKPRSSPYSFRGLGQDGLKLWYGLAREAGIKIITEVMQYDQIEAMVDYVDIFQVGARNTQNFNLLDALGEVDKPVMLKRGISGTIEELLHSAEYIFSGGNEKILLCERGIRSYETAYRNTMDINAIAMLKEKTHLPVIADPSHGVGLRDFVEPVALASAMAGADGVIFEIHPIPEKAASDAQQTLSFPQSAELSRKLRALHKLQSQDFYA
ncbi:MAG: bifunctional 3-deoxy-7-phosphoheptulonate synthase/chorismate mutase [Bacteroidia bacterium]|nr:bifunctional 3-deoxy-7-phosphoheptulonate synthase/chorismate mutase [Bacteroidia bacterium]